VRLAGLCDLHEEEIFRRGLVAAQVGAPRTRTDARLLVEAAVGRETLPRPLDALLAAVRPTEDQDR
jgi:hypothetical protein